MDDNELSTWPWGENDMDDVIYANIYGIPKEERKKGRKDEDWHYVISESDPKRYEEHQKQLHGYKWSGVCNVKSTLLRMHQTLLSYNRWCDQTGRSPEITSGTILGNLADFLLAQAQDSETTVDGITCYMSYTDLERLRRDMIREVADRLGLWFKKRGPSVVQMNERLTAYTETLRQEMSLSINPPTPLSIGIMEMSMLIEGLLSKVGTRSMESIVQDIILHLMFLYTNRRPGVLLPTDKYPDHLSWSAITMNEIYLYGKRPNAEFRHVPAIIKLRNPKDTQDSTKEECEYLASAFPTDKFILCSLGLYLVALAVHRGIPQNGDGTLDGYGDLLTTRFHKKPSLEKLPILFQALPDGTVSKIKPMSASQGVGRMKEQLVQAGLAVSGVPFHGYKGDGPKVLPKAYLTLGSFDVVGWDTRKDAPAILDTLLKPSEGTVQVRFVKFLLAKMKEEAKGPSPCRTCRNDTTCNAEEKQKRYDLEELLDHHVKETFHSPRQEFRRYMRETSNEIGWCTTFDAFGQKKEAQPIQCHWCKTIKPIRDLEKYIAQNHLVQIPSGHILYLQTRYLNTATTPTQRADQSRSLIRVQLDAQEGVPPMEQWKVLLAEKGNSQEVIDYIEQYVKRFKEKAAKRDREDLSETETIGSSIFAPAQSDYTVHEDSSSDTDCGYNRGAWWYKGAHRT